MNVSSGAVAGGLLVAAMSQVAAAPLAHADDPVTEMFESVQSSINQGDQLIGIGSEYFAGGDVQDGLNFDLAGIDTVLLSPAHDILVDATDILTGEPLHVSMSFDPLANPLPTDLAEGFAAAQDWVGFAQGDFTLSAGDLADGLYGSATAFDLYGLEALFVEAPNALLIGLAGSLGT